MKRLIEKGEYCKLLQETDLSQMPYTLLLGTAWKRATKDLEKNSAYLIFLEVELTLISVQILFNRFERFSVLFQRAKYILIFFCTVQPFPTTLTLFTA